jgi:phospholipid-binding lipoprotein MlaA
MWHHYPLVGTGFTTKRSYSMRAYPFLIGLILSGCAKHHTKCLCFNAPHKHDVSIKLSNKADDEPNLEAITDPRDPIESFNRKVFAFNNILDQTIFMPFIGFYRVMPLCAKNRITNIIDTVETPISMANCMFQGKIHDFLAHTARLFFNLTFGICGLFDFASVLKIQPQRQDFGKTLQYLFRVPAGPFLIIPFLGPASFRDAIGQAVDCCLLPTTYYDKTAVVYYPASYLVTQSKITSIQYDLGATFDDAYAALRDAYLMSRGDGIPTHDTGTQNVIAPPDLLGDDADDDAGSQSRAPDLLGDDADDDAGSQSRAPDLLGDDADDDAGSLLRTDDQKESSPDLLD